MKNHKAFGIIRAINPLSILALGLSGALVFGQAGGAGPGGGAAGGQGGGARGGGGGAAAAGGIPNATSGQTAAIAAMEQSLTNETGAATAARLALVTAAFADPPDESELQTKVETLRSAELALALARADRFNKIQESADKLNSEQARALALQGLRGGGRGGGGRGGRPPVTNPGGFGPEPALAQTQKLVAADKLAATLFASEPTIVNPADMDIDARGRIWVTEGANYRMNGLLRPGGDRIMILEDTDLDGKADKTTVFYQDPTVNAALGICVLGNKVIVSDSPYVFILTDTDGDGVADKRELLFEDNSRGNHDHDIHAFSFGPDGKLYFNFGNQIRELRRPKGGTMELPLHGPVPAHEFDAVVDVEGKPVIGDGKPYRQGMVLRCNLDGSEVEVLGWNFRNPYEVAVDSFGSLWQSDNDDDGNQGTRILQVMSYGNYGFQDEITGANWTQQTGARGAPFPARLQLHWHLADPGVAPLLLGTGAGSPTGMTVYEGKLLPESFQNKPIHTDARPGVVRAYSTAKSGAGYTASITNILTPLPDETWYRPSDVCVAPDGSLYITDWNDGTVGGNLMLDRVLETMTGRIYRVAPTGQKPSVPKLDLETPAGAVAALQSPNSATRYLAWTALHTMKAAAENDLLKLAAKKSAPVPDEPRMRARALFVLAQIPGGEKKYVEQALRDDNEDIRIVGLRLAHELKLDVIPYVRQVSKDPSAMVRREALLTLRHSASPEAADLWATLAQQYDGQDRWYLEALGIGADSQWDAFLTAWLAKVGDNVYTPAAREIIWRSRSNAKTPDLLMKIIQNKETDEAQKTRYMRSFDFVSGPEKDAALLQLLTN